MKEQASQGETETLLIFPRSPAASRTDPLTEGLEQATVGRPHSEGPSCSHIADRTGRQQGLQRVVVMKPEGYLTIVIVRKWDISH